MAENTGKMCVCGGQVVSETKEIKTVGDLPYAFRAIALGDLKVSGKANVTVCYCDSCGLMYNPEVVRNGQLAKAS